MEAIDTDLVAKPITRVFKRRKAGGTVEYLVGLEDKSNVKLWVTEEEIRDKNLIDKFEAEEQEQKKQEKRRKRAQSTPNEEGETPPAPEKKRRTKAAAPKESTDDHTKKLKRIHGIVQLKPEVQLLVTYEDQDEPEVVSSKTLKRRFPSQLVNFYESHIVLKDAE